jgi:superfamily II DNA or RNA helicase
MILRPHQSVASDAIFKEWRDNESTLVLMPTGGGKMIPFADVIRRVFRTVLEAEKNLQQTASASLAIINQRKVGRVTPCAPSVFPR